MSQTPYGMAVRAATDTTVLQGFEGMALEELLVALTAFGRPTVYQNDYGTWYAKIEMRVSVKGSAFKVESDYRMPSPLAAVRQLAERVLEVLK